MISQETAKRLRNNHSFKEFQAYIVEKIEELDSVSGLEKMSNEEAGETAKVRFLASNALKEIMKPILTFREKTEPSTEEITKKKGEYGF